MQLTDQVDVRLEMTSWAATPEKQHTLFLGLWV